MRKITYKKLILIISAFVFLAMIFLYYFKDKNKEKSKKILYNISSKEKIIFIENPSQYSKDNILKLLDKKTMELSSNKKSKAYCKLIFKDDEGRFSGELLDENSKDEKIVSNFSGRFEVLEKLDDLTYKLEVENIKIKNKDKFDSKNVFVFPNHFRSKNQFILRLPNTKLYSLIDGYEKYDFQNIVTDTLNVFTLETGGYVYYEKVEVK